MKLKFNLFIPESYYMRNGINEKYGAHIVIEHNKKNPSMSKGIDVMPGTETNIGLQKHVIKRLSKPYRSNCTNEYLEKNVKNYVDQGFQYSSKICKGLCFAYLLEQQCHCVHPSLLEGFGIETWFANLSQITPCNVSFHSKDVLCMTNVDSSVRGDVGENWDQPCECNPECIEISYEVKLLVCNYQTLLRYDTNLIFINLCFYFLLLVKSLIKFMAT